MKTQPRNTGLLSRSHDVRDREGFDEVTFEQTMLEYVQIIRGMQLDHQERRGHATTSSVQMIHMRCIRFRVRMKKTLNKPKNSISPRSDAHLPKPLVLASHSPLADMKK